MTHAAGLGGGTYAITGDLKQSLEVASLPIFMFPERASGDISRTWISGRNYFFPPAPANGRSAINTDSIEKYLEQLGGTLSPQQVPSNERQSPLVTSGGMQTLDLGGRWRNAEFNPGGVVYVVRDKTTGELLKVGQTTTEKFIGRFEKYVTAANKTGRALEIDAFEVELSQRGTIEGQIRRHLGAGPGALPWDNTGGRLGRTGSGTPSAPLATQWGIEDEN